MARVSTAVLRTGWFLGLSVMLNVLVITFSDEKLSFLLKDQLHFNAESAATFDLIVALPGYLRVLMGVSVDAVPFLGSHRRSYYVLSWLAVATGMAALAFMPNYGLTNVGVALITYTAGANLLFVIMDAVLARVGNDTNEVGRLQSIQQGVRVLIGVSFAGPLSGYVTQNWSYSACFGVAALTALCGVGVTLLIDERPLRSGRETGFCVALRSHQPLGTALRSVGLWVLVAYIFYLLLTPGITTAKFYYSVDVLHLSKQTLGNLKVFSSAGSTIGILIFGLISRRLPIYWITFLVFASDAIGYVINFALLGQSSAYAVSFLDGIVAYIYTLSMITLFAAACPRGAEAAIYGLFAGAQTLAGALSEKIGSAIYDTFGGASGGHFLEGWHALLWMGFTMTLAGAVFIPFLPEWTRSSSLRESVV